VVPYAWFLRLIPNNTRGFVHAWGKAPAATSVEKRGMRLLPLLFMIDVVQPSRKMLKTNRRCLFGTTSLLAICLAATISLASGVAIYSPPRNLTVAIPNGNQCTDNATWIGSGSTSLDCIGAVQLLYNREVSYWKDQDFEFISEKVKGRSIPWQRTPRKYTVGEMLPCTKPVRK